MDGHEIYAWASQPRLRQHGVNLGDFLMCANILLSGNNYQKISLLLKFMNLGMVSKQTFHRVQKLYCLPEIDKEWERTLQATHMRLNGKEIVACGKCQQVQLLFILYKL